MATEAFILTYVVFSLAVIAVIVTLYLVLRLLDWAKDRPLPGSRSGIFNIAIVSLVAMLAMFLLVDIEMTIVFPNIKGALLTLIEAIDLVATAIIALALVVVFMMLRSARRQK